MLRFTRHYKDTIQERLTILTSSCAKCIESTGVPKITKVELGLTKLLQKENGAVFYSQCSNSGGDAVMAKKVTVGMAESNGSLSLRV